MSIVGTKYQIFEDDKLVVRRIIKAKDNNNIFILKELGSNETIKISAEELADKYIRIIPDAFLNIMIVNEPAFESAYIKDVYFCVNRATDITMGVNEPSLILRQNAYSKFKNMSSQSFDTVYIGECATIVNSTKEELADLMTFEEIKKQYSIATYLDDSEEDILECMSSKFKKDIDIVLKNIKDSMPPMVKGASENLKEFWADNDFIGNYKSIFNITQIDFPIVIGKESYNSTGDIILNEKQKKRLEDMLRRYVSNIRVIKYDKDIDISKIVNVQHVIVCDSENKIYLIAYDVDGYYAENESDAQVLESFGIVQ
jgi:hypothetical protein